MRAVDGVSYRLHRARTLGIVGESGCGKSVTAQSILRIVPNPGKIVGGEMHAPPPARRGPPNGQAVSAQPVDLVDDLAPNGREIRSIRGDEIAYIYQEPMSALSPVHTIGHQIIEVIRLHQRSGRRRPRRRAIEMLQPGRAAPPGGGARRATPTSSAGGCASAP